MGCCFTSNQQKNTNSNPSQIPTGGQKKIESIQQLKINASSFVFHKKGSILKQYTTGAKLGQGAFGQVRIGIHKATRQERAIKTVKKSGITKDFNEQSKFFSQVDILRKADHPNIVKMYQFYQDPGHFHIVTELLRGGELFDFIIKHKMLSEPIAAHFFKQTLSAVLYCHNSGIVHRDLKPENLLLEKDSPDSLIKIIDFGTSTLFDPHERLHHKYGTSYYIAPQVLKNNYNEKCDIWSLGVILYILISGKPPFYGKDDKAILEKVQIGKFSMNGPQWENVSSNAKQLISSMLNMNPDRRPSAEDCLKSKWIKQNTHASVQRVPLNSLDTLKQFRADQKLQKAVMTFITSQLVNTKDTKQLTEHFQALDQNGDGKLSKQELLDGYKMLGSTDPQGEVENIMREVDSDANGYIDYSEFVTATIQRETLLSKSNLDQAFQAFDSDGSGTISAAELRGILGAEIAADESVWGELISEVDQNGDGEIDLREFKEMMIKMF